MSSNEQTTLLVTGASGPFGRRVVELLVEAQVGPVIAATRHPDQIADLARRGAIVRRADFDDRQSLDAAFFGADRMLLSFAGSASPAGTAFTRHWWALDAARRAGVRYVAYSSITRPDADSAVISAADHRATEALLPEVVPNWTVMRHNLYTDLLLHDVRDAIATGRLTAAAGDGGAAYVTLEDCACVAASLLAGPQMKTMTLPAASILDEAEHSGTTLDITGPDVITFSELARIISEESGHPVTYVPIKTDVLRTGIAGASRLYPIAQWKLSLETAIANGQFAEVSSAVSDLTGRNPMSVSRFLSRHRADLLPFRERRAG